MEFIHTARELQIYTVRKCIGAMKKRYTFYGGQQLANLSIEVYDYAKRANSIYPTNAHEAQMRRDYFLRALAATQSMISQIEVACEITHFDADIMHGWMELVSKEIRLLKAVMRTDKKRYGDLT